VSLLVLFGDELRGFYRSKVMLFLWVGMPVLAAGLFLWSPDTGGDIPLSALVALLVSSLSGTLASVMLVVTVINEREAHVYDLFVIRPIRRRDILLAKYLAVFVCVQVAAVLAFLTGIAFDYAYHGTDVATSWGMITDSLVMSVVVLAISSAAGILIGIVSPSILVGAILVIYMGNQIAGGMGALAALYLDSDAVALALGALVAAALLSVSVVLFDRKQL
jgi:ABC-type transport system involved in multi-copper enzyme maturation permease subunit